MKLFKILILLGCLASQLSAQKLRYIDTSVFEVIDSISAYYKVKEPFRTSEEAVISKLKQMYGLTNADEFTLFNTIRDTKNNEHKKFIQIHNGIPVVGGGLNIHLDSEGFAQYANGYFANSFDSKPIVISSEDAIQRAIKSCEGKMKFKWQDSLSENALKIDQNDERATYSPKAELVLQLDLEKNLFVTVYKIAIHAIETMKSEYVYVSASDGSIWKRHPVEFACGRNHLADESTCKVVDKAIKNEAEDLFDHSIFNKKNAPENKIQYSGSGCSNNCMSSFGATKFYGTQNIKIGETTVWLQCPYMIGVGGYNDCWVRLYENCQSVVHTRMNNLDEHVSSNTTNFDLWSLPSCLSFNGVINGTFASKESIQIHWIMEKANEFYRSQTIFNRNGFDNNGIATVSNTDDASPNMIDNAVFNSFTNVFNFGKKGVLGNFDPISSDIIAHEYTHGVSKFSVPGGFVFGGISGALCESFSDILGKMVEHYVKLNYSTGTTFNYITGDEVFNNTTWATQYQVGTNLYSWYTRTVKRDMSNPNNTYDPDTYGGVNWIDPALNPFAAQGFGGMHVNAQVQNYWFYLLAEGGSGTNDLNNSYCVNGIGKDKAMRIVYHNLTTNLLSNASFNDARAGSILSAITLYGANSNEVAQVTQAWYAVGVGANYNGVVEVKLHTALGTENYNYNCKVSVYDFIDASPGGNVTITSNTEIEMLHDIDIKFGSIYNAYIAPTCNGNSARLISSNSGTPYNSSTDNSEGSVLSRKASPDVVTDLNVKIIPNPSDGYFTIDLDKNAEYPKSISINDIMGKIVSEIIYPSSYEVKCDLTGVKKGIYVVKLNYSGSIVTKRLIIN